MTCKDCQHFSNYLGGTCLGWADMSETNENAEVGSCSRFRLKSKEPKYTPDIKEEYSEYDHNLDGFGEFWK